MGDASVPDASTRSGPGQKVAYPNVAFSTMSRFGADLAKWFHRPVPIWITEYGEQTTPEYPSFLGGVTYAQQASDIKKALQLAQENPYVQMFVWFIFRDSTAQTWFSGVLKKNGTKKPGYNAFASAASGVVGHSQTIDPGKTFSVVAAGAGDGVLQPDRDEGRHDLGPLAGEEEAPDLPAAAADPEGRDDHDPGQVQAGEGRSPTR